MPHETNHETRGATRTTEATATGAGADATAGAACDQALVARLADGVDTTSTLGVSGFGEGRRRDVARTVDAALEVLRASATHGSADDADAAVASLAEATWGPGALPGSGGRGGAGGWASRGGASHDGARRGEAGHDGASGLLGRLARTLHLPGTRRAGDDGGAAGGAVGAGVAGWAGGTGTPATLTPELVDRAEVALKLRQASLLKEASVLDALLGDLAEQSRDLANLSAAARLRASTTPGRSRELSSRAEQLAASRLLAEQATAALTLVRHADASMVDALGEVVEGALPIWRKLAASSARATEPGAAAGSGAAAGPGFAANPGATAGPRFAAGPGTTACPGLPAEPPEGLSSSLRHLEDAERESRSAGEEAARALRAARPMS